MSPPSESTRAREVFRCLEPFESTIQPFSFAAGSHNADRVAVGSEDTALAAFAQLGALRLNAQRCMISLLTKDTEYVLAESTRTLSLQSDLVHNSRDALWLGTSSFPLEQGLATLGLDLWRTSTENREAPADADHYYTNGATAHYHIINDLRQNGHEALHERLFVQRGKTLRFYCSVPIRTPAGHVVGSYAVMDTEPRFGVRHDDMEFLEDLADTVMGHLESKRATLQRKRGDRLIKGLALFNDGKDSLRDWWLMNYSRNTRGEGQRRRRRSHSDEDLRNERADEELGMTYRAEEVDHRGTQIHSNTEAKDMAANVQTENDAPLPEIGNSSLKSGHLSQEKHEGFDLSRETHAAFARGSNLIREAISAEGVAFIDADFSRSKNATQNQVEASATETESDASSPHDTDTANATPLNGDSAEVGCALLGFSTKIKSSLRGFAASSKHSSLPKAYIRSLIRRYPQGKVFSYHDGKALTSSSGTELSDVSTESTPASGKKRKRRSREAVDAITLSGVFNQPRSVAFLPLWDGRRERWRSAVFVWNNAPNRYLDKTEDVTYLAAFSNSLMAELSRLDAIAADQAKATFISSVSHELRSPLHGVLAGVELLEDSSLNNYQQEMTTTISMAGKTLLDTINNILDFTKINSFTDIQRKDRKTKDQGRNTAFKTADMGEVGVTSSVDLALLTENVVNTTVTAKSFQFSKRTVETADVPAAEQQVAVILNIAKRPNWNLSISPGSWTRVITNLLGNSLKYTKAGVISVTLQCKPTEKSQKSQISLIIEDTGQGMSTEYLRHHLYTPFMQENTHAVGTGLGLSIVKQIVQDFGGRINFESELGRGTKVTIAFNSRFDEDAETTFDVPKQLGRRLKLGFSTTNMEADRDIKSTASKICREWLECESTLVSIKDSTSEYDVILVTESEYEEWNHRRQVADHKEPSLVVLGAVASSSSTTRQSAAKNAIFINPPFGPRKLSRALSAAVSASQIPHPSPTNPLGISQTATIRTRASPPRPQAQPQQIKRDEPLGVYQLSPTAISPAPQPPSPEELPSPPTPPLKKILIVEDNAINAKLLTAAMQKLQRPYATASNGLEAVTTYACAPSAFALVLMDISMPVMDGFVATETIRALEDKNGWPRCGIMALTGVGDAEARKRAFSAGVDGFMMKPASMQKLREIVSELRD